MRHIIMKNFLWISLALAFSACSSSPKQAGMDTELPVLYLTKEYPKVELDIHEIADVEYIPLETTDESIIGKAPYYAISEKYIVSLASIIDKETRFFDRKGKFLFKINRYGQGAEEYTSPFNVSIDFENEECYVYDGYQHKIQVYTFSGKWIRTLKTQEGTAFINMFNYNKQYLIGYNSFHDYRNIKNFPEDKHPYHLIDKKNGEHKPLDIMVEKKVSKTFRKGAGHFESMQGINPIIANNNNILIADFGLDTLYQYKENKLTPIAVQYPPIHSNDEPTIVAPEIYTDSYLFFRPIHMKYVAGDVNKPYWDAPYLMWKRETNEIVEVTEWKDFNFLNKKNVLYAMNGQWNLPNYIHFGYSAEKLCEEYEAGNLKGKLKEIASKLEFDDNLVLVLCKLK